jgi:hypothetical protein
VPVVLCLGIALPPGLRSTRLALRPRLSAACTRLPRAPLREGESEPPRVWAFELRQAITPRLTARVQGLGPPRPPLGPFPGLGDEGRGAEDPAAGRPHERGSALRGGLAGWAARTEGAPQRRRAAPTAVIRGAGRAGTPTARAAPLPTAAQAAESSGIRRRVPTGHGHGPMPARLGGFTGRLTAPGRPRPGHPRLRGRGRLTLARPHRRPRGLARAGRRGGRPAPRGNARGGRRAPPAPAGSTLPAFAPPGGRQVGRAAALRHLRPACSLARVGRPGNPGRHHGRWHGGKPPAAGRARAGRGEQGPLRGSRPRKTRATAPCGWAPSGQARGQPGPRVRGPGGAALEAPGSLRLIPHGPRATRAPPASLGEGVAPEPLRPIVTSSASGRRHEPACTGRHRRPLAEARKPRALAGGAPLAVITGAGLGGPRPIGGRRPVSAETPALLGHRLGWLLTPGRATHGERHCQGRPPADVLAQDGGLGGGPSSLAEGPGMPTPPGVHRPAGPPWGGAPARASSEIPPALRHRGPQEDRSACERQPQTRRGRRTPRPLQTS